MRKGNGILLLIKEMIPTAPSQLYMMEDVQQKEGRYNAMLVCVPKKWKRRLISNTDISSPFLKEATDRDASSFL